jgi:hypothetical protein
MQDQTLKAMIITITMIIHHKIKDEKSMKISSRMGYLILHLDRGGLIYFWIRNPSDQDYSADDSEGIE